MTKSMIEKLHWLNASEQLPDADNAVTYWTNMPRGPQ